MVRNVLLPWDEVHATVRSMEISIMKYLKVNDNDKYMCVSRG